MRNFPSLVLCTRFRGLCDPGAEISGTFDRWDVMNELQGE